MFKRILSLIFVIVMLFAVGCDQTVVYDDLSNYEEEVVEKPVDVNPLTGLGDIDSEKINQRPVAIMINNLNIAQKVQTGVSQADIVYETEAEGGLTRLMGVYQDISDLDKIGTVRSARYQYIDLAMGHNAIYVHAGKNLYCYNNGGLNHLADVDDIDFLADKKTLEYSAKSGAYERKNNGLATEHTLYTNAADLWEDITESFDTKETNVKTWANFAEEGNEVTLSGGTATNIVVPFPANKSKFKYNDQTGLYTRIIGTENHQDYFTNETTQVKNIFILFTTMSHFGDKYTRRVDLQGGEGYYVTNGNLQPIKWTKGNASDGFKFTDADGNELTVNAGKSWVCIANQSTCTPTFE